MGIFLSIFEWLLNALTDFANTLLSVLPKSPFSDLLNTFSNIPYLGWVNWFIPFRDFIYIGGLWLTVIGLFYIYQIIMRWIKVIGD